MLQKFKRIDWVDSVKAIAMLAVVLGHIATPLTPFLFSWHLPLFFFVSGFFIDTKNVTKNEVIKDLKKYMIPFYIFALIGLGIEILKRSLFPNYSFIIPEIHIQDELMGIFYYMDFIHMHQYGFVLWFLPALFWSKTILAGIGKYVRSIPIQWAIVLGVFLFGLYGWKLPFAINAGCIGLFWMFFGLQLFHVLKNKPLPFWISVVCFAGCLFLPKPLINIAVYQVDVPWYAIPYSLLIILSIIGMVQHIQQHMPIRLLSLWGKETMAIFIIHPYINNIAFIISGLILSKAWLLTYGISIGMLSILLLIYERYQRKSGNIA